MAPQPLLPPLVPGTQTLWIVSWSFDVGDEIRRLRSLASVEVGVVRDAIVSSLASVGVDITAQQVDTLVETDIDEWSVVIVESDEASAEEVVDAIRSQKFMDALSIALGRKVDVKAPTISSMIVTPPSAPPKKSDGAGADVGLIVGCVVGGLVGLCTIGLLVWYCCRQKWPTNTVGQEPGGGSSDSSRLPWTKRPGHPLDELLASWLRV